VLEDMIVWRKKPHQIPELEFELPHTSEFISNLLKTFGLTVYKNIGQTGIVAVLKNGDSKRSASLKVPKILKIKLLNYFQKRCQKLGIV
jgi:metal-dependent amidase/aminoacylase/carboxypeptidase family protein